MFSKFFWFLRCIFLRLTGLKIGFPSYFGKPIFLKGKKNISIGSKVRVFPGARIEAYDGSKIEIGSNVVIGQNFHLTCAKRIKIGSGTHITNEVMITDIDHDYKDINMPVHEQKFLINETIIGDNCFMGSGCKIQAGSKLGKHCIVGANSVIRGTFPDYSVVVGVPGKIVKKFNKKTSNWEKL